MQHEEGGDTNLGACSGVQMANAMLVRSGPYWLVARTVARERFDVFGSGSAEVDCREDGGHSSG